MKTLLTYIFLFSTTLFAQDFSVTSEKTIGGDQYDFMTALRFPDQSGYLFYGLSYSGISGDKTEPSRGDADLWLVRTDNQYNILWDKTIGGSGTELVRDALIFDNHIYVSISSNSPISGEKNISNYGGFDIWLLKLDLNGGIIWQNVYGGSENERAPILKTLNNHLLLTCNTQSSNSGNLTGINKGFLDVWIGEIDTLNGAIVNQNMFGSSSMEEAVNVHVFGGRIFLQLFGIIGGDGDIPALSPDFDEDIVVLELGANLDIQDTKTFWGNSRDLPGELLQDTQGNFFLVGSSSSPTSGNKVSNGYGSDDIWVIKLDQNLDIIWEKSYGGTASDGTGVSLAYIDNNGSVVIVGTSSSSSGSGVKTSPNFGGSDLWILTLSSSNGNIITDVSFGGSDNDYAMATIPINNSGDLLVVSNSSSPISGNKEVGTNGLEDLWLLELDASDYLTIKESDVHASHTFFPNPFQGEVTLKITNPDEFDYILFYSVDGKTLLEKTLNTDAQITFELPVSQTIIFYELVGETRFERGKLVAR